MIEIAINDWLGGLSAPLSAVDISESDGLPAIVYRIGSEFTPTDGDAPYGAKGHNIEVSVWHPEYKAASLIAQDIRDALDISRQGYLVSVDDRGDYKADDTGAYGIVLDVQVTVLDQTEEPLQDGLRHAVKQALMNNTLCDARVFASRVGFASANQYPCAGVSIREIEIETNNDDQKRKVELIINIKTPSNLISENRLEIVVAQVESVLNPDAKLFQESNINLERIDTQYTAVGRLHYEHRQVRFAVEYYQTHPDSGDLNPFAIAAVDWNIDGDSDAEAQDLINLPQE